MTTFSGRTFSKEQQSYTIEELQHAIGENTQELEKVRQERLRAEEQITYIVKETKRRADLMIENSEVVDALQQLGHLLQEEMHLSEQLNDQASVDRNHISHLQEMIKYATEKVRSITAEILEVKQRLADVKTRNMEASALIPGNQLNK